MMNVMRNANKLVGLRDIEVNYYLNHVWVVNVDNVPTSTISQVESSLNNQGCVTITIHVGLNFSEISDKFRCVISQISSCSMILIIITHDHFTNEELLLNVIGYMRCCQMCILYTGSDIADASLVSTQEILSMVGGLSIKFGNDDLDDISLNSGSISNSLRFNCISWCGHVSEICGKQGLIYVGWHLLSYIFGMELGLKMVVYELLEMKDPIEICRLKAKARGFNKKVNKDGMGYRKPNAKVKLGALFSWSLIEYDTIIVIGGYPCKELRRMHRFIEANHKQVVLIDTAFNESGEFDSVQVIKGEWDYDVSINDNLDKLHIFIKNDRCLIVDDTWMPKNKWCRLKDKLRALRPTKGMDISIKFNWYTDSSEDSIWVENMLTLMLTPGINDSNESRVLLRHGIYGSEITKKDYMNVLEAWRRFTMPEQCFLFGYYFNKVIRCVDVLTENLWELDGYVILSLYALGNVSSNMRLSVLEDWSDYGINYMLNVYTDLNNPSNVVSYKNYRDIVYKYSDVINLYNHGVYSLTVDKLYNVLYINGLPRKGFKLIGDLRNIKEVVNEASKRVLLTNFHLPDDATYQSSMFSFASRLKWITIKLRCYREIGMDSTYLLRYDILSKMFGLGGVRYDAKTHAIILDVEKNKATVVRAFSGKRRICMNKYLMDSQGDEYHIEVSGHVLNLMLWELLEPGNLLLWLKQIIFYYKNIDERYGSNKADSTRRSKTLKSLWENGYFIETSVDRLDKRWHTKIEMLLACAIAGEYWSRLVALDERHKMVLESMSISVFDIFYNDIN